MSLENLRPRHHFGSLAFGLHNLDEVVVLDRPLVRRIELEISAGCIELCRPQRLTKNLRVRYFRLLRSRLH